MELEQDLADAQFRTPDIAPAGPNNPPWGALAGIGVWIGSVMCILVVPAIFLLPYLALHKPRILDSERLVEFAKTDPTAVLLQIGAILPAHLLTVLIAWLVVTKVRKYNFREMLGWETGGWRMWASFGGVLAIFFGVSVLVAQVSPEQDNDLLKILRSSREAVYIIAFIATFTAPFVEEVVYRGVLYSAFQRSIGVPGAFLLTTFLFAVVHVPQYWPSYSTIFLLTLLSLILTTIRVKTNNLLPCIIFHTIFNGLQSISLIFEPMNAPNAPDPTGLIFHLLR
ncbi:MAG: CPBP family intramembrane glutamic endopeptidase [Pyrinomonadaceae bacterium]